MRVLTLINYLILLDAILHKALRLLKKKVSKYSEVPS